MFRALPRYNIVEFTVVRFKEDSYYRSFCKIADKEQKLYFEGMAEGNSPLIAQLRALAEAYERSCLRSYFGTQATTIGGGYPYGAGVGFRKKSAIIRAYGEYFERFVLSTNKHTLDRLQTEEFPSPVGTLYVSLIFEHECILGSGYGISRQDSEDSANRSVIRKRDYPQIVPHFKFSGEIPKLINITPASEAWLNCFYVGH